MSFECRNCSKKGVPASVGGGIPPGLVKLFACGKCHEALYCSKECQQKDWKMWHKSSCAAWIKDREKLMARGERSLHDRSVAAVKSGFKHTLVNNGKTNNLIEGENWLNMMVGVVHEPEEQVKDEMSAGVCLHIDGPHCCIIRNSKTTKVTLVRVGAGEEEVLHRFQMRMLSPGDKLLVHFPAPSNPLLFSFQENYTMEYKRETCIWGGN